MAPIISAAGVGKTFRQLKRQSGFGGAIKSLFSRDYTEIRAVDGVSFAIEPGEAVGYLGPNGAGKSTMIKMMTGILTPSAGTLSVLGREPHAHRACRRPTGATGIRHTHHRTCLVPAGHRRGYTPRQARTRR